jgi:hypothetical protein
MMRCDNPEVVSRPGLEPGRKLGHLLETLTGDVFTVAQFEGSSVVLRAPYFELVMGQTVTGSILPTNRA